MQRRHGQPCAPHAVSSGRRCRPRRPGLPSCWPLPAAGWPSPGRPAPQPPCAPCCRRHPWPRRPGPAWGSGSLRHRPAQPPRPAHTVRAPGGRQHRRTAVGPDWSVARESNPFVSWKASDDFPIARGTLSTLMLTSHKRNSSHRLFSISRRVALTNHASVIHESHPCNSPEIGQSLPSRRFLAAKTCESLGTIATRGVSPCRRGCGMSSSSDGWPAHVCRTSVRRPGHRRRTRSPRLPHRPRRRRCSANRSRAWPRP